MTATCDTKDRCLSPKVEEDVAKLYQDLTASRVLCASVILDLKVHQLFLVGPVFWKPWTKILKKIRSVIAFTPIWLGFDTSQIFCL